MPLGRGAQEKSGYPRRNARNTKSSATGRPDGQGPLAGPGKAGSTGSLSTNYPYKRSGGKHGTGGSEVGPLGRDVRGYEVQSGGVNPSTHIAKTGKGNRSLLPRISP